MSGPTHGELFVLSAPSGTGKTTMIRRMMDAGMRDLPDFVFSVSHTTRAPRRGEVDGHDYHFIDQERFERMIEEDEFLEWSVVHGQLKGTSREEVLPRLASGVDVLLDIDVQGAEKVLAKHPEAVSVFIMPPSYRALEQRLTGRGLDEPAQIRRRLDVSISEIACYRHYQYVIINDDLERASQVLAAIILEKRHRLARMDDQLSRVLAGFPALEARAGSDEEAEKRSSSGEDSREDR